MWLLCIGLCKRLNLCLICKFLCKGTVCQSTLVVWDNSQGRVAITFGTGKVARSTLSSCAIYQSLNILWTQAQRRIAIMECFFKLTQFDPCRAAIDNCLHIARIKAKRS